MFFASGLVPLLLSSFAAAAILKRDPICIRIEATISRASNVYYPGDPLYEKGVSHWAGSSSQVSKCVVEPGTAADVGHVLTILGKTRTPFAVKGGGHASNPNFSSTTGVHISMYRFSQVVYNPATQTAQIGAGLIWDEVYAALDPYGVNVLGGRVSGVGVAGLILGGGYSWKTNQYGMTVDTVTAYELVKPNGNVVTVTKASDPNLFWALKGGFNNFGIVTKFTLKTFPQTKVWGGMVLVGPDHIPDVTAATAAFASVTDPKASLITAYNYGFPEISLLLVYDGPTPPPGIFDDFLAIPSLMSDIGTKSFTQLVAGFPTDSTKGNRGVFNSISLLEYTPSLLNVILNETNYWGAKLTPKSGAFISYSVEPFLPSIYSHNTDASAWPPYRAKPFQPINIFFSWTNAAFDNEYHEAMRTTTKVIYDAAKAEGQDLTNTLVYPNYAIFDTPLSTIYGSSLPKLRTIKCLVDPQNVMGLAGGWKF